MEIEARITTIPPLEGIGFREFELRLIKGPIAVGEPGGGTYAELYSKDYLVFLDETGRLRVFVSTGAGWAPVPDELYPQPPHPGDQIRHIGACFDQAARLVLAYELDGRVYVYQWDAVTQQYITRGPFPGVDPVLIQDATIGFYPPDSDVLLLHLSPDRTRLILRVQRELYGTPRGVATFSRPVVLDQIHALPYYGQVVGSYVDSPRETGFAVRTDLYPVYVKDLVANLSIAPPTDWNYVPVVIVREGGPDGIGLTTITPPTEWGYVPVVVTRHLEDSVGGLAALAPTDWSYILVALVYEAEDFLAAIAVTPPLEWNYIMQVVPYDGGTDSAGALTITPPTSWVYQLE